jgi:hypothetical protein
MATGAPERVAFQSPDASPVRAAAGEQSQEDELPATEEQRLQALRGQLHDAAFSFLRSGAYAGYGTARFHVLTRAAAGPRQAGTATHGPSKPTRRTSAPRLRRTLRATQTTWGWHRQHRFPRPGVCVRRVARRIPSDLPVSPLLWQRMPEFASRLNLPSGGLGKTQIKLLFGSEQAYEAYAEALRLVDGVQQREAVAGKFRHQLHEHFPELDSSVADALFDAELEEFALKREVARIHLGHTRAERIAVESVDERFAMLAAGSMQPVISSLIQAALKKRAAPRAGMSALEAMNKSVDKRLHRPTGAHTRDRSLVEEGLEALEDRAKAMLSLCENLRAELQERLRSGGAAPVLLEVQSAPLCHALPKITHEGSYPKQGSYPLISLSEPCTRSNEEHRRRQKKKPNKPSLPNKPTLTLACKTRAMWGRNWRHSAAKTSGCGT